MNLNCLNLRFPGGVARACRLMIAGVALMQLTASVNAENLYVTPAGAGSRNGSDWNNAIAGFGSVVWGSGAGQLGAGDTLWVAGGLYTNRLQLKGSGAPGNLINIKRAQAVNPECTSAAGWSSTFDSTAVIKSSNYGIIITSSLTNGPGRYITIDGGVRDGIRCNFADVSGNVGILVEGYGAFNTTFRNIGSYGPSTNVYSPQNFANDVRCLVIRTYTSGATEPFPSNFVFDRCTFAGSCAMAFYVYVRNVIVENCDIHTIEAKNSAVHVNLVYVMRSDNCTFRYNTFHDTAGGVGIFFTDYGSGGVQSSNFWIYGNVFRDDAGTSERWITVRDTAGGTGPLYIYNNTFVKGYGGISIGAPLNPNVESYIRNNIFVDVPAYQISIPGGNDYVTVSDNIITNSYAMFQNPGATNVLPPPFNWQWVRDLRPKSGSLPVNAGANLGAPYNVDLVGNTRGSDGGWDIGAYEYTSATNPPSDATPPSVSVTWPLAGVTVSNVVTLSASANDNAGGSGVASVTFLVDGVAVGTDTTPPYALSWTSGSVSNGAHAIQARAHDAAGNQATSSAASVNVQNAIADTTAPTVALTAPPANATVSNVVTLSASASDNAGGSGVASVTFLVDGVVIGTDTVAPYTLNWNSGTVLNGSRALQARAVDAAGNQATSSVVVVTVQNAIADATAPTVTLTAPSNGATVSNAVTLSASASDNAGGSGVASVTFLVDGVVAGTDTVAPYTLNWNSGTVLNGSRALQARAVDAAGNQALSTTVWVGVQNAAADTTAPTVTLTAPSAGATVSNMVTLSAIASDNTGGSGVASVTFLVDGVAVGTDTTAPYTLSWTSGSVSNGVRTIQALGRDVAGNQASSMSVTVTVQNLPPRPSQTDGLIAMFDFVDQGGLNVLDSSGNGNTGVLVAPATMGTAEAGGCLTLNGTNGYVRVPSTPTLEQVSSGVTISGWAQIQVPSYMQDIARKVISETTDVYPYSAYDLVIQDYDGATFKPRMGVTRSDSTRGLAYGAPHPYGSRCHIAGTYDGMTVRLYVNGVQEGSTAFTGSVIQTSQPLCIGRFGTVGNTVNGLIDDFRLYNRALSAAEIQKFATRPAPPSNLRQIGPP